MDNLLPVLRQFVRDLEGKVAILEKDNGELKQINKSFEDKISNQEQENESLVNDMKTNQEEHLEEKIRWAKDTDEILQKMEKKNLEDKECCAAKHEKEIEEEHKKITTIEKELNKGKNELQHISDRLEEEELLSSNLKKEARRLKEDVITDLEEQICNYETKRVKANAELRTAKERIMVLEEETLVEEQKKVVSLTKKLLQEEEKVRVEIEKNVQAVVDMQTCNDVIHNLKNELNDQEQNNQNIIKQLEKDHEHAIQTMKEQHSHGILSLEDQMDAQRNGNESKINEMNDVHENLVTELQTEKDMIHNELIEALDDKEELQHTILELSNKCDILVNTCKEMELNMQDLESDREEILQEYELDKENHLKQYNDKVNHYETILENKTKDTQTMQNALHEQIQTLQNISNEQMKEHTIEKKSYDDMIIEMEYFINNISKRLEITSNNISFMADEHSTMNRKMIDFYYRFQNNNNNNNNNFNQHSRNSNACGNGPFSNNNNHHYYTFGSKSTNSSPSPSSSKFPHQQCNNNGMQMLEYNKTLSLSPSSACSFDEQIDSDTRNIQIIPQSMTNDSDTDKTLDLYSA